MNTFLSTSGFRQKHAFSQGLQKEQEMHGYSEMKMAKTSPLALGLQTTQAASGDS